MIRNRKSVRDISELVKFDWLNNLHEVVISEKEKRRF